MLNFKSVMMCGCALAILTGCANQNLQMQRENVLEQNKAFHHSKVSFVDDMDVLVSDLRAFKESNYLKVMIEFMNADDGANREFVYQIEWYDQNGIPKETTSWRPQRVVGNQKIKVVEMATLPSIVDYKVIISTKK